MVTWPSSPRLETHAEPLTLGLARGGIATSGRDFRRWTRNGRERHHLIDPFTGEPARTDLISVTVTGETAVEAEVRAKSLFLLGSGAARAEADRLGAASVLVREDGTVLHAGGLA